MSMAAEARMGRLRSRLVPRITAAVAAATLSVPLLGLGLAPARADALECDSVRRLSDNYLLDLRIRMMLDYRTHRYIRLENTGRGWERIAGSHRFTRDGNTRLILIANEFVTSYLEPLTGYYYYIDRSGVTLSVWAHCAMVGGISPLF